MSWHAAPLPEVRILRFWPVDREALVAVANVKIGEHIRLNAVRLLRMADDTYTVATRPKPRGEYGPPHDVYLSPDLRVAVAEALLAIHRKRLAEAA